MRRLAVLLTLFLLVPAAMAAGDDAFPLDPLVDVFAMSGGSGAIAGLGTGDVDGDGLLDVVAVGGETVQVAVGTPTGFTGSGLTLPGQAARGVAVADVDGDGLDDAVIAADDAVQVLDGHGEAPPLRFGARTPVGAPGAAAVALDATDLDGDGDPDVAVAVGGSGADAGTVAILRNDGGVLSVAGRVATPAAGLALLPVAGGDTRPDLVLRGAPGDELAVAAGGPDLTFGTPVSLGTVAGSDAPIAGDLDGDGRPELVVPEHSGAMALLLGGPAGPGTPLPLEVPGSLAYGRPALADLDRDGADDLLTSASTMRFYGGGGDGTFAAPVHGPALDWGRIAIADEDGDGLDDALVLRRDGDGWWRLSVLLGRAPALVAEGRQELGDVQVGARSAPVRVLVHNRGPGTAPAVSASIVGHVEHFELVTDGCAGAPLEPGASCPVDVAAVPKTVGSWQLSVGGTGPGATSQGAAVVAFRGAGAPAADPGRPRPPGLPPRLPRPGRTPAPRPVPPAVATVGAPGKAVVHVRGKDVRVSTGWVVQCAAGEAACEVTARALPAKGARSAPLGRSRMLVKAGASRAAAVELGPKASRALRAGRVVRVRLALRVARAGTAFANAVTAERTVVLKAPRKR